MIRTAIVTIFGLFVSGCVTVPPDLSQSRSPCRSEPGGWCGFIRDAAVETYGYAMLASNAYRDEDTYTRLPPGFVARDIAENDDSGLAYSIFDRYEMFEGKRGSLLTRIIAFRGTETGSTEDIFSGSLGDKQREGARIAYVNERAALNDAGWTDVPIAVTGHSLGGALATQISIDNPDVKAFVFNSSPFFSGDPSANSGNRVAISERGEFLRRLRQFRTASAADTFVINCEPATGAAEKHGIRPLGDCLTWIAAYEDPRALALVEANNIMKPAVECGEADKAHPGTGKPDAELCIHAVNIPESD